MVGVVNCRKVETAMSTEALNRIIKEVDAPTPQERRELIDRLAHEEQNSHGRIVRRPGTLKGTVKYMAPDFDALVEDFRKYME
jgi:hypothetical protein